MFNPSGTRHRICQTVHLPAARAAPPATQRFSLLLHQVAGVSFDDEPDFLPVDELK